MASIRDVAKKAGLSVATVSHVINGTRPARAETQERVRSAVRELGYSTNQVARNLAAGRSSFLGLLISDIRNPFFPEITSTFQDQALLHEMEPMVLNTNYDIQRTLHCVKRMVGMQVPGVAILTSQIEPSVMELLAQKEIAAVYLDLGRVDRFISNISIDYELGIAEALDHITQSGHRQVAFIGGPPHLHSARRRKQAFLECAKARELVVSGAIDSDFSVRGGYYACSKLVGNSGQTAIVTGNDLTAIGALHCLYDRGVRVPADVSVVGFDDISFAQYTQPALTTVAVPREEIGRLAFRALWEMISNPQLPGKEYRVATNLMVRQSTARAPHLSQ